MKSKAIFDRWSHIQYHSWPFQMYKQYNAELSAYIWAEYAAHKFAYQQLGKEGANWNDTMQKYVIMPNHIWNFADLKDWSDAFNGQQNFLYLNCVMALSSNFESFLESILSLAIESDPGAMLGASHTIDGAYLLKHKMLKKDAYLKKVQECSKGMWSKRKKCIKELIGTYPEELDQYESELEKIRVLRNKVGHAFGRDIKKARNFESLDKIPMEHITLTKIKKWLDVTFSVATAMDSFLLDRMIGEYQAVLAYHNNKSKWVNMKSGEQVVALKKFYGEKDQSLGKLFCKSLIEYYQAL